MAIAYRANGTVDFGINSVTPLIPAAQVVGDMMLLIGNGKPFDLGWSVATPGWASLGRVQSGTTAAGIDVGSMVTEVWWKEATADPETDPIITEGTPAFNIVGGIVVVFSKGASETWNTPVLVGGGDETAGTAVSITCGSNPGITTDDHVFCWYSSCTDAATPSTAHVVPTATGVTFTNTPVGTDPETALGGDMGMCLDRSTVSGTASAAPVLSATAAADAVATVGGLVRLRVSGAIPQAVAVSATVTAALAASKITSQAIAITVTLAVALARSIGKLVTSSTTLGAGILRSVGKGIFSTISHAVELLRRIPQSVAVTVSHTVALGTIKSIQKAIAITVTFTAAVARTIGKFIGVAVSHAAELARSTGKGIAAGVTLSLGVARQTAKTLAVTVTHTVALASTKVATRVIAVSVALGVVLTRSIGKALTVSASLAASIVRSIGKSVAVVGDFVVGLARRVGKLIGAVTLGISAGLVAGLTRNIIWHFGEPYLKWGFGEPSQKWRFGEPGIR